SGSSPHGCCSTGTWGTDRATTSCSRSPGDARWVAWVAWVEWVGWVRVRRVRRLAGRALRDVLLFFRNDALDFDRAVGEHGRERANGGEHGREHRADHADGEREFGDASGSLLDDDAADVALVQQLPDCLHELIR